MQKKSIKLAEPRGFCSGVKAALNIVEQALADGPFPVCVLHEIVHNEHIVNDFKRRGVRFIDRLDEAPAGATLVFSAHGVPKDIEEQAHSMSLRVLDATCPLVKALQSKAVQLEREGFTVILVGHKEHAELVGVLGRLPQGRARVVLKDEEVDALEDLPGKCACLSQTTLSVADVSRTIAKLKLKCPSLLVGGGVCYATRDRQAAVEKLAKTCDTVFVIGSLRSSNSKRLKEVAAAAGARAFLISSCQEISEAMLEGALRLGVTAGASAPEKLVQETVRFLETKGFTLS